MARQLRASAKPVGLVALFDTVRPGYHLYNPHVSAWQRRLYRWLREVQFHGYNVLALQGRERRDYLVRRARPATRRMLGRWADKIQRAPFLRSEDPIEELEPAPRASSRATQSYVPGDYEGRIVLFRGRRLPIGARGGQALGWDSLRIADLVIHELPGFHGSCILEPNVRTLASLLLSYLRPFEENRQG